MDIIIRNLGQWRCYIVPGFTGSEINGKLCYHDTLDNLIRIAEQQILPLVKEGKIRAFKHMRWPNHPESPFKDYLPAMCIYVDDLKKDELRETLLERTELHHIYHQSEEETELRMSSPEFAEVTKQKIPDVFLAK